MGYNSYIYKRIYDEYTTKYIQARARADRRAAELHEAFPEIAEIDKMLSDIDKNSKDFSKFSKLRDDISAYLKTILNGLF